MGFGDALINLVKIAFNGCISFANVNGHLSDTIYIGRGLHQGSPLSPILFLLAAQVFTRNIEKNPAIEGLVVDKVPLLQSLFADDTDLFLKADTDCVRAVFSDLDNFGRYSGCKYNIDKTRCIPIGRSRLNTRLISDLRQSYGQGFVPDDGKFSALGITFNGDNNRTISETNYSKKIEKVQNLIKIWSRRNLTVYGRLTLVKCFLLSQFVYLINPLPSPIKKMILQINGLLYKFLWGGGREKLKRELIDLPKEKGGIGMINFNNFILGLKVKLISKILDKNFDHPWKNIIINQFRFPDHPMISLEAGAIKPNRGFCLDLITCYDNWKQQSAECCKKTINFCIWGGGIPGNNSNFWNDNLISKNILYASDFIDEQGDILSYSTFRLKHHIRATAFTKTEHAHITLALRRFHSTNDQLKSISNIGYGINLTVLLTEDRTSLTEPDSKTIREKMIVSPEIKYLSIPQFTKWANIIEQLKDEATWAHIFENLYKLSNHFKLIQHQYKIFTMIATSRYMRYKMKIENSYECPHCLSGTIENLQHIYLDCPITHNFYEGIEHFIKEKIDREFISSKFYQLSVSHQNAAINYIYLVANWYVGRKFQYGKKLYWDEYYKYLKIMQIGEKAAVTVVFREILST